MKRVKQNRPMQLGLALGGGGMKGWAHVGVIEVLEAYDLRPDAIAGCSAGALMGAAYASGMPVEEMLRIMREQDTSGYFTLRLDGKSLLDWEGFRQGLLDLYGDTRMEDLPIPFFIVCTDLETGQEVVLNEGPLVDAILASCAVPGVFPPVNVGGRYLIDGGLLNNVPVSVLTDAGVPFTIASKLHRNFSEQGLQASTYFRKPSESMEGRVQRVLGRFRRGARDLPTAFAVLNRSVDILMAQLESYRLQACMPDVLINPRLEDIGSLSFSEDKEEIYRRGREAALEQRSALIALARELGRGRTSATG